MLFLKPPIVSLTVLVATVAAGMLYSIKCDTAVDTSNVFLAQIPRHTYFAQKSNVFNVVFVKKAWGSTSAAFFWPLLQLPPRYRQN